MLFNSFEFLLFLLAVLSIYYLPFTKDYQVSVLVAASLFFYGYHKPYLLTILCLSIAVNAYASYKVYTIQSLKYKKLILILGIVFNLSLLSFFKYLSLLASTLIQLPPEQSSTLLDYILFIPLPVGISFYTFEGISLLIDIYRKEYIVIREEGLTFGKHLLNTTFFISFFPHLLAGPILKAHDFYHQIDSKKWVDINWMRVFHYCILGFFFKMVVADNLKDLTNILTFPYFRAYSSVSLLIALFGFSMQIFADFAGYSFIAVGIALMFGYELSLNFNYPYLSSSFSEFWSRWHISLSTWLKEYLYIPLGGNRKGSGRTNINIMIVMLLGGLWHGASWTFALWGGVHGLALVIEKFLKKYTSLIFKNMQHILGWICVFTLVTFLWILFVLPDIYHVAYFLVAIKNNIYKPIIKFGNHLEILIYSSFVILYHLRNFIKQKALLPIIFENPMTIRSLIYALLLFLIVTNSGDAGKFIYFQF